MRAPGCRRILEKTELFMRRHGLLRKGDAVLVGLSGGPDSSALLAVLAALRRKYSLRLVAAHLNHGIAKNAARGHEKAARKAAVRFDIPLLLGAADVPRLAKNQKRSIEESGRLARYAFFERAAAEARCGKIATAHTLDDQAETLLMRLLRGAGLSGLVGIPPKRKHGRTLEIIRPLLSCRKTELVSFLEWADIPFYSDRSNRDTRFLRNRIRHEILPRLALLNPRIHEAFSSLRDVCDENQDFIFRSAQRAFSRCRAGKRGVLRIRLEPLRRLHPAILNEVLRQAVCLKKGDLKKMTHDHVMAMVEILRSREHSLDLNLPGYLLVKKTKTYLEFRRAVH